MAKIEMIRGDTRTITATFVDSSNNPLDLTGGTVFFTVNASKEPTDDTSAVVEKDITSFDDPASGVCIITLDSSDTNSVTPGTYWYDCQFVSSVGIVTSLERAKFIVKGDITRRTA